MLDKAKLKELMGDMYIKSVRELSQKSHVPYSTLNRMFQGYDMHVSTIIELSKFFEVPIDVLIKKSYTIVSYKDGNKMDFNTSNFMEATHQIMMENNTVVEAKIY